MSLLFANARVFDGRSGDCAEGLWVRVAHGLIQEISTTPLPAPEGTQVIDCAGGTLMPGLIDCHVHAFASDVAVGRIESAGDAYRTAHAVRMLGHALDCGFTTVRDIGGGNHSLWRALAEGLVRGPRYFYAGKILSMTGGHGDMRPIDERPRYEAVCGCAGAGANVFAVIADGMDAVLRATREELRQGAHCIKIMGSGGVASPTDPIWMNQYREDEIRAIVNECTERRTYVSAHCHPASAVRRCVEFGVRCIEHGTLIDDDTASFVAERGAFIVPTLSIIFALVEQGRALGFPPQSQAKVEQVFEQAISGLEAMRRAGVKLAYGTDLLGSTYTDQCREFTLRSRVFTPLEILRQATSTAAELLMMDGRIGCIAPGAEADLLLVDGDPLADIGLLAADGRHLRAIVRAGELVKRETTA
ncbi:amidohydrolase family protein [Ideonella sp. YS5]|uniref:metal-dependent hydrolase family protein n=1 Tax=Ideonella sp. YS5 TaxID=3453714 RepID=UPI003EEEB414